MFGRGRFKDRSLGYRDRGLAVGLCSVEQNFFESPRNLLLPGRCCPVFATQGRVGQEYVARRSAQLEPTHGWLGRRTADYDPGGLSDQPRETWHLLF
jgi:hypothetical protein